MMPFLNPLDALIRKVPFSFFANFCIRGPGVSLGRIWGSCRLKMRVSELAPHILLQLHTERGPWDWTGECG